MNCGCEVKMEQRYTGEKQGGGSIYTMAPVIVYCKTHSAAPHLLAALKDLTNYATHHHGPNEQPVANARAAIDEAVS